MANKWTDEQLAAITTCGSNILVSAAAGAGKTAVLVERIIRFLTDKEKPIDIDKLLVVTFTEAAAAEMRERIAAALQKEISVNRRIELTRQLSLLNGAAISTLHSFCLGVIRRYFYLLEVDPSFRIADETEANLLRQDVVNEVLEEMFAREDEDFLSLVADYGGKKSDEALPGLILQLYQFAWSNPHPKKWLTQTAAMYEDCHGRSGLPQQWFTPVYEGLRLTLEEASASLQEAVHLMRLPGGPLNYESVLLHEIGQVGQLTGLLDASWEELRQAWLGIVFNRLPAAKDADDELKKQIKQLRDRVKKILTKAGVTFFTRSAQEFVQEIIELTPKIRALTKLVVYFADAYTAAKKKSGILDFNDLEHYCLQILLDDNASGLQPSEAAEELRSRYEHVLVDEYQDINPVQDAILQLVSRQGVKEPPNLFMVGDVKQSIYGFRLGDPSLFLAKYQCYMPQKNENAPGQKILLSKNFRCRTNVVEAVNFLFEQLMTAEALEIDYDDKAALVCAASYPQGEENTLHNEPVEVLLLDRKTAGAEDDDLSSLEREGVLVAQKINELVLEKKVRVFDKESETYRPLRFRDIVILLRSTSNRASQLTEILAKNQIPSYAELTSGYFAATEVETMLALLQVIDNPQQDIPLTALLRSPFVGCSLEELAVIRAHGGKDVNFWQAVKLAADAQIPVLSEKLGRFISNLQRWRTLARREKLAAFIAAVYRESHYADYVSGLPDGIKRQANLRALFSRARQFDRFTRQGVSRFLQFIDQLRSSGDDLGTARTLGENEDVVRIMSIHKSKGLEFPVVFLCDTGKEFNFQDSRATLLMHREYGLAPLIVKNEANIRYPSLPYLALRMAAEAQTKAEEMRILYVALTRAREKLILVGSVPNLDETAAAWGRLRHLPQKQLPAYLLRRAKNYLDWLGYALCRHPQMAGGLNTDSADHDVQFRLMLMPHDSQVAAAREIQEEQSREIKSALLNLQPLPVETKRDIENAVSDCLNYSYPYNAAKLPAKLSVTEIKRRFGAVSEEEGETAAFPPDPWKRPAFLAKKQGPTALELGLVYHSVLQNLDLEQSMNAETVAVQLKCMIERGTITAEMLPFLKPEKVAAFFQTEPGRMVLENKDHVLREWPFTLALPAEELMEGQEDTVIVQGIIDLLAVTPSGFILIDYKTDYVSEGKLSHLAEKYRLQFDYYKRAVETILHQPVCAGYLYAITAEKAIKVC